MIRLTAWSKFRHIVQTEWTHLTTLNRSDRAWQMPFAAALASGLPLMIGAYFSHMEYALIASIGGLVFLYLPATPLHDRMLTLMICAFGMITCYSMGLMSQFIPSLTILVLIFLTVAVTMACRFYQLAPPGNLFFIMAAAIGAYTPARLPDVTHNASFLALGCLLAILIAFFYSIYSFRIQAPKAAAPIAAPDFDFVILDSVVIGAFIGISLLIAQLLQLDRPYWVPITCLAVIQGMSLRAVWNKQLQRIIGTGIGLLLSWGLLSISLNSWYIALMVTILAFSIEVSIVRHYGLAVIFITPLTIFLAETASFGSYPITPLIEARFFDTILGCMVGLAGGVCLHNLCFRQLAGKLIRCLTPPLFK